MSLHSKEEVANFQTDLQVVFGMLRYKGAKYKNEMQNYVNKHKDYFGHLTWENFLAIREMMSLSKKMEKILEKDYKENVDMCGALEALCEDYRVEGKRSGRMEGMQLAAKICKELMKNPIITDREIVEKIGCTKEEVTRARKMFEE